HGRLDAVSPCLAGPGAILVDTALDGEVPVACYAYVIEAVRRHPAELGVASLIGRSLTWTAMPAHSRAGPGWSRTISVTIVPREGRTRIRIEEKLDQLVKNVFGTIVGAVGGAGALVPVIPLAVFGLAGLIPLGLGLWVGGARGLGRKLYRTRVASRERGLPLTVQAILGSAEDYMASRQPGPG